MYSRYKIDNYHWSNLDVFDFYGSNFIYTSMKYEFLNEKMKMELNLLIFCFYKIIYNFGWFNYFGKRVITYVVVSRFLYCAWNPLHWGMRLKELIKEKNNFKKNIFCLRRRSLCLNGSGTFRSLFHSLLN